MNDQFVSAIMSVAVVLIVALFFFAVTQWISGRRQYRTFLSYMGLLAPRGQLDLTFWLIWLGSLLFGVASTILLFHWSVELREMMQAPSSPYAKILKVTEGMWVPIFGLTYCFVQASATEEIFFRGLLGRRLINTFGFIKGNIIQALLFWLMHLAIFRLVTGAWISGLQIYILFTTSILGFILGYVNFRNGNRSIIPSWILHGSTNFATFLTLAALL